MKDLYSLSRWFCRHFPQYRGVRRTKNLFEKQEAYAICKPTKDGYIVHIDKSICEGGCIAFLCHEVAHALSYETDTDETGHGQFFGAAYSVVWQCYLKWVDS